MRYESERVVRKMEDAGGAATLVRVNLDFPLRDVDDETTDGTFVGLMSKGLPALQAIEAAQVNVKGS